MYDIMYANDVGPNVNLRELSTPHKSRTRATSFTPTLSNQVGKSNLKFKTPIELSKILHNSLEAKYFLHLG